MEAEKEWDLSKMKSRPNLYAKQLKKQITLRLSPDVIEYFKEMAEETGIPYQSLINLYLLDSVTQRERYNCPGKLRLNNKKYEMCT